MTHREVIIKALSETTGLTESEIHVEKPENSDFGDYSSNIAMAMFSKSQTTSNKPQTSIKLQVSKFKNPRDLAQKIAELIGNWNLENENYLDKVQVEGPGFINFFLKKDVLLDILLSISSHKETFGYTPLLVKKRIMFEYGDANTHKLPHIGHLYSYTYGESMSRILKMAGAEVRKVCYQGDIGTHVAKCLWAFKKFNPQVPKSLAEKVQLLQELYQKGSAAFEESEESKKEIIEINKAIYDKEPEIISLWEETRSWSLDYYKYFENQLDVNYDRYYYESEVYGKGKEIVEENLEKIFKESEGAIIFEGSKYDLHDRVFITKYKTPTYEAKDMALQKLKFEEWPMDLCIITTANEQDEYFKVVFKALEKLDNNYKGKLKHIGFGMINLKSGKMSSRTGEIVGALGVIHDVMELSLAQNPDPDIAEAVAIGAIKYSFLKNNPLQNLTFDPKESIAKEGNSGPYLQYTYARTQSVLSKSTFKGSTLQGSSLTNQEFNDEEAKLLRTFIHFPQVVQEAAEKYSPNLVCTYLYDLAQKYNGFYNAHKIIGSENEELRVKITEATGIILKTGLNLLGIEAPLKM